VSIESRGLHHLALRVTDLGRAKQFYTSTLGFPVVLEVEGLALVNVNGVLMGIRGGASETSAADRFDPFRVGLDHLALAAADRESLAAMKTRLDGAGVPNNGVEHDELTGADYIAFYDPDGIAWELYAMS
jgi:catechol 2,3-dioxygenase-like lactoylglutathione lyase family enzyme